MADIANDLEPPLETNQEELDVQTFNSINDDGGGPSIGDIAEEEEKKKKKNLYNDEYDLDEENPLAGSDDEEDDIQVTIGKIEPINVQFSLKHTTHERHHGTKLDVDAVPTINDQPIYDVDLAQMEDRPWRKPGADITDYFNYGFTEETWNTYCERQKKLRTEFTSQAAVNKALFSNIYLANPLAMPAMNRPTTVIDGSSNVKVLTDNGGRFKAHLHSKDEPVMRTVIGTAPVSGPPGVGSSGAPPPIDFSKPPPGMPPPVQVPPSGLPPESLAATTDMPPGTDGPPGVGSTSVDAPPGVDMPQNTIPTVGAPNTMDMSMPPPGFNPALPPPGMSARPPPIGLPTVAIGAGFNTMMPPPPNFNVRYPMNLPGGMGRPPPLMGREFDSRRDSRDEDDDRRHGRRRSRSRSPRRSDRRRDERDDRRDRDRDRKERDRDRGDRSNRRRSRSRDERERRRDRKDEDSDRKRSRRHDDEDDRRERRERRKKEEKDRSPDKDSQGRASNDEEDKDL